MTAKQWRRAGKFITIESLTKAGTTVRIDYTEASPLQIAYCISFESPIVLFILSMAPDKKQLKM